MLSRMSMLFTVLFYFPVMAQAQESAVIACQPSKTSLNGIVVVDADIRLYADAALTSPIDVPAGTQLVVVSHDELIASSGYACKDTIAGRICGTLATRQDVVTLAPLVIDASNQKVSTLKGVHYFIIGGECNDNFRRFRGIECSKYGC